MARVERKQLRAQQDEGTQYVTVHVTDNYSYTAPKEMDMSKMPLPYGARGATTRRSVRPLPDLSHHGC